MPELKRELKIEAKSMITDQSNVSFCIVLKLLAPVLLLIFKIRQAWSELLKILAGIDDGGGVI